MFNEHDTYHERIEEFLKTYTGGLTCTCPVVAEVSHMLEFNVQAQIYFLTWIRSGGVTVQSIEYEDIGRIIELSREYPDHKKEQGQHTDPSVCGTAKGVFCSAIGNRF